MSDQAVQLTAVAALAKIRDMFPVPAPGSPLEQLWAAAMADPIGVPEYVRAVVQESAAQSAPIGVLLEMREAAASARKKASARGMALAEKLESWANRIELDNDLRLSDAVRAYIEGMSVSVDVSTGDHDAGHRYFGTVTEVMDDPTDKHGVTLLVQDAAPNFEVDPLVAVSENGEGQEKACPTCGAEAGQMCSDASGREHVRKVHSMRQHPVYQHSEIMALCKDHPYHVADHVVRLQRALTPA